ncbi:MAG: hypothetical protein WC564_04325 [Patescibacteria group bacterium]|jgi:hypothetical protein
MDYEKINLLVSNDPDLMARAGGIVGTVFSRNGAQLFQIDNNNNESIRQELRRFKRDLENKGIVPPNSDIELSDLYERIVRPVRMNITK